MTRLRLILSSLHHHARAHVGTLLGAVVASAVLIGALVVGDSVRYSLREQALERLRNIHLAVVQHDRYFRAALAKDIDLGDGVTVAPMLRLQSSAVAGEGADIQRAPNTQLIGVDESFWKIAGIPAPNLKVSDDDEDSDIIDVLINQRLADRLRISSGDKFTARVAKPSLLPRDVPLAVEGEFDDLVVLLTLRVHAILPAEHLGNFNLRPDPIAPFNVFLPLQPLQEQAGKQGRRKPSLMAGRANTLIVATDQDDHSLLDRANLELTGHWQLTDAQLQVQPVEDAAGPPMVELISDRVFLDPAVIDAAESVGRIIGTHQTVLGYMVNRIDSVTNGMVVPYSIVASVPPAGSRMGAPTAAQLRPGEMLINDWMQTNYFGAKVGDSIKLTWFKLGRGREMEEASRSFKVVGVVPTGGPGGGRGVMPPFPGVRELKRMRELDQLGFRPDQALLDINSADNDDYWDTHQGSPKAFISAADADAMWSNRYGSATAVRYPGGDGAVENIANAFRRTFNPAHTGLAFRDVRSQAIAGDSASDFGGLFIGLSFFLVAAALILMGLLFVFSVEQRAKEVGTLLAVGFTGQQVRNLLLTEGTLLAIGGAVLGAFAGLGYTRALVYGLSSQWVGAIGGRNVIQYHHEISTVLMGTAIAITVAAFTIWLTVRKLRQARAIELLNTGAGSPLGEKATDGKRSIYIALGCLLAALGLGAAMGEAQGMAKAGGFFGAGALLLTGGLFLCRALFLNLGHSGGKAALTLSSLGLRGSARRRGRSLACVCLLACGIFMVIAVGAFRIDPTENATAPESGTGGFAYFAQSDLAVLHDLNHEDGRYHYPFEDYTQALPADFVPLRMREGDDASCLNLNQAREPRLLGVEAERLKDRFTFAATMEIDGKSGWELLDHKLTDDTVPAIVDQNTGMWALHVKLGDTLDYPTENGGTMRLKIVGMLAFSMLQGDVIVSESAMVKHFPSNSGWRAFLADRPADGKPTAWEAMLNTGLANHGLDLQRADVRLAEFSQVQNTYISIFQALGGLSLLLGSLGLGVVVLRNVLERRGELAVMQAVGFRRESLRRLVCTEHGLLLALGLAVGVGAALLAVWPSLNAPGSAMPWASLGWMLGGVLASGMLWTWLAATAALRGELLPALRHE